jgi:hypothetical protein
MRRENNRKKPVEEETSSTRVQANEVRLYQGLPERRQARNNNNYKTILKSASITEKASSHTSTSRRGKRGMWAGGGLNETEAR